MSLRLDWQWFCEHCLKTLLRLVSAVGRIPLLPETRPWTFLILFRSAGIVSVFFARVSPSLNLESDGLLASVHHVAVGSRSTAPPRFLSA